MNLYPLPSDVLSFVSQRGGMLLIDQLEKVEPDKGRASMTVRNSNVFYEHKGGLNPVAFIELIAQTAAAYNGYIDMSNNRPVRPGFLVGVKEFQITGSAAAGDKLEIEINRVLEIYNATVLDGKICSDDGTTIASGILNLWILNEEPPSAPDVADTVPVSGEHSKAAVELGRDRCAVGSYIFERLRIVKKEEDKLTTCIAFEPGFIGFQGHFPQAPILPGVVMLQTAVASTELLLKKCLRFSKVDKAKFMDQVLPNQLLKAECTVSSGAKGRQSRVQLSVDDKKVASVIFRCEEA